MASGTTGDDDFRCASRVQTRRTIGPELEVRQCERPVECIEDCHRRRRFLPGKRHRQILALIGERTGFLSGQENMIDFEESNVGVAV